MKIVNPMSASGPSSAARTRHRARVLRAGPLAGAIMAAVLIAGCGGSSSGGGVAHINSSTSAAKTSTKPKGKPNEIAFVQCMRSHGVTDYPDPNSSGEIRLTPSVTSSPEFQTASSDCKSLKPNGYMTSAQQSKVVAEMLKLAVCMRAHGVPHMPDPSEASSNGGVGFSAGDGVDPNSPVFKRAVQECRGFPKLPKSGGG